MATVNLGAIKFNWKGAFNNSTAYAVDDVVSSLGSSYVCILASQGNAVSNGTYWNQMSSAGTNGTNGTDLGTTLTTRGDIVYKGASALTRLPKGTSGYFLKQGANDPEWGAVDLTALSAASLTSGTIPNARYGTPTFNGSNITNLPASGKVLQVKTASTTSLIQSSNNCGGKNFPQNVGYSDGVQVVSVSITPLSTTSHFYVWFTCASGAGGNGIAVAGIFCGVTRLNITSGNCYAADINGLSVHGTQDTTGLSGAQTIQARNLGTVAGNQHGVNAGGGGNASNGGNATMTVMEIED